MSRIPDYYKKRLGDLEGYLADGKTPKLRLVFAPETKRTHGKLAGLPKYHDPETGEPLKCWVLECWYPATMCGSREEWQYELLGPYPADCHEDCCNGGFWGIRSPITTYGEYIELTESVLSSIERKQFMDIQWSLLSEVERQKQLDASLSERNKKLDAEAWDEMNVRLDEYAKNKEKWDNDDNRVFSWADKYAINVPGSKMPIGGPKLKK